MSAAPLEQAPVRQPPKRARTPFLRKVGQIFTRDFYRYTDGRIWAPEKDVENPLMRSIARTLGATARALYTASEHTIGANMISRRLQATYTGVDDALFRHGMDKIATAQDQAWRETWVKNGLAPNGLLQPHPKPTTDPAWITSRGTREVDIANWPLIIQPKDVKEKAYRSTFAAMYIVYKYGTNIDLSDEDRKLAIGNEMHEAWLEINPPTEANQHQQVPFANLPEDEQAKDLEQLSIAMRMVRETPGLEGAMRRVFSHPEG